MLNVSVRPKFFERFARLLVHSSSVARKTGKAEPSATAHFPATKIHGNQICLLAGNSTD
jgi:hypothetical protein